MKEREEKIRKKYKHKEEKIGEEITDEGDQQDLRPPTPNLWSVRVRKVWEEKL